MYGEFAMNRGGDNHRHDRLADEKPPKPACRPRPKSQARQDRGDKRKEHDGQAPPGPFRFFRRGNERHATSIQAGCERKNRHGNHAGKQQQQCRKIALDGQIKTA